MSILVQHFEIQGFQGQVWMPIVAALIVACLFFTRRRRNRE